MADYTITPKAPLMFRDGRPFGAADQANTLPFPLPSTTAGAMRAAWAEQQEFDYRNAIRLLEKQISGPLLVEITAKQKTKSSTEKLAAVLFPRPADSLCLNHADGKRIYRLTPKPVSDDVEGIDLPSGPLLPVFLDSENKEKPAEQAPRFWYFQSMIEWLTDDSYRELFADTQGVGLLPVETRTHVAIDPSTLSNRTGQLYQTSGLDFSEQKISRYNEKFSGWKEHNFALLVRFHENHLSHTYRTIGGEARLGYIEDAGNLWPELPANLEKAISESNHFRIVLVTPAIFDHGYLPGWLNDRLEGSPPGLEKVRLRLRAVAINRWQPVSGWQMRAIGSTPPGARPVRRMAPAGTMYWFEKIEGDSSEISRLWLGSISDQQSQDGFGLVLPGVWSPTTA